MYWDGEDLLQHKTVLSVQRILTRVLEGVTSVRGHVDEEDTPALEVTEVHSVTLV